MKLKQEITEKKGEGMGKSKRSGKVRFARETTYNMGLEYCDTTICKVVGNRRARRSAAKPSRECQEILNEKNARLKFQRYANANFADGRDVCVHLTFDNGHKPESRAACKAIMDKFIRRVKYAWAKAQIEQQLRWLYVIEGEDGKRIHVHMLMTGGLAAAKIKKLWGMAMIVNVDTLQAGQQGFAALGVYLTKQGKLADGEHRWYGSRNLIDPLKEELNAKIPMDEVAELGEYIQNELEAGVDVISTAERYAPIEERYPGYYLSEATAKYLEQFREWVIHIQLYRKDTPAGEMETKRRSREESKIADRRGAFDVL